MKRILFLFQLVIVATLFVGCQDDDYVADDTRPTDTYYLYGKGGTDFICGSLKSAYVYFDEGYLVTYFTSSYGTATMYEIKNFVDESEVVTLTYDRGEGIKYFDEYRFTMSFDAVVSVDDAGNETLVHYEIVDKEGSVYYDYIVNSDIDANTMSTIVTGNSDFNAWGNYGEDDQYDFYGSGSSEVDGMFIYSAVRYVQK